MLFFIWLLIILFGFAFSQLPDEKTDFRIKQPLLLEQQRKIMDRLKRKEKIFKFDIQKFKVEEKKEEKCIHIKAISIQGYSRVSREEIFKIAGKYSGKCLGKSSIANLLNEINNLYIKKGYITSRAYINPEGLKKGIIDIKIIEGKIEEIKGNAEGLSTTFYGLKGKVLNIRDIEIGVEMLNRLKSNNVSINLEPGSSRGFTKIIVMNRPGKPYSFSISFNNFGYKETGQYRISSIIRLENPLRISDIFTLSINTTNRQDPNKRSVTNSLYYSFPINRFLFSLSFSNMTYAQSLRGVIANYSMLTTNNSTSLETEYRIFHSSRLKISSGLSFSLRDNSTLIEEVKINTMSYRYNKGSIFIKNTFYLDRLYISITAHLHKGMGGDEKFVVDVYRNSEVYKISGYFTKYSIEGNIFYTFPYSINFISLIYGQYSSERLYSAEQISVGGPFSVRGFFKDTLSGDTGFYVRNNVERSFRLSDKFLVNPFIGIDYGIVDCTKDSFCGAIAGASAGFNIAYGSLLLNIFHSIAFYYPNYLDNKGFTGIMLSVNM